MLNEFYRNRAIEKMDDLVGIVGRISSLLSREGFNGGLGSGMNRKEIAYANYKALIGSVREREIGELNFDDKAYEDIAAALLSRSWDMSDDMNSIFYELNRIFKRVEDKLKSTGLEGTGVVTAHDLYLERFRKEAVENFRDADSIDVWDLSEYDADKCRNGGAYGFGKRFVNFGDSWRILRITSADFCPYCRSWDCAGGCEEGERADNTPYSAEDALSELQRMVSKFEANGSEWSFEVR